MFLTSTSPSNPCKLVSKHILCQHRKLSRTPGDHTGRSSFGWTTRLSHCLCIKKNLQNWTNWEFSEDIGVKFSYLLHQLDKKSCLATIVTVLFEDSIRNYSSEKYRKYPDGLNHVSYVVSIRVFIARSHHTVLSRTKTLQSEEVYVRKRQHTSAYVIIRQHTSVYVNIRHHTSSYVSIRWDLRCSSRSDVLGPVTDLLHMTTYTTTCTGAEHQVCKSAVVCLRTHVRRRLQRTRIFQQTSRPKSATCTVCIVTFALVLQMFTRERKK